MRVLLLGAGGMLASDLRAVAPEGAEIYSARQEEVDVTLEGAVIAALRDTRPHVVLNCAAYTDVDRAEGMRDAAFAVNGDAPGILGRAAIRVDGPLVVHYSTDYVFNGHGPRPYREEDETDPLGVYGASKLAGERALRASGAPHLIIRTQWLFGLEGRSFPRTMWERALSAKPTRVVSDQVGRPTYTVDLAEATWRLLAGSAENTVLHVANSGTATWYNVAARVFQAAGVPQLLTPCKAAEYATAARRPAYSALDTSRYAALAGSDLPRWEDALARFVERLKVEVSSEGV